MERIVELFTETSQSFFTGLFENLFNMILTALFFWFPGASS